MAKQTINLGTFSNDGTGDPIRNGGDIINDNFNEIYDIVGDGTNVYAGIVTNVKPGSTNLEFSGQSDNVTIDLADRIDIERGFFDYVGIGTTEKNNDLAVRSDGHSFEVKADRGGDGEQSIISYDRAGQLYDPLVFQASTIIISTMVM